MILEAKNVLYSYKSKRDKIVLKMYLPLLRKPHSMRLSVPAVRAKPPFFPFWRDWIIRYQETSFMVARTSAKKD